MNAKTIGIISIKGGAGKTTTAINIAKLLSKKGKRVLVIDANFSAPNLRIYLGLQEPKIGIHEILQEGYNIKKALYDTPYGFHLLPAKLNNQRPTKVLDLKLHLEELKPFYDFILIDSSPNVNAEILATINASDSLILITNPDYATISCTLRALKIIKENNGKVEGIIINKKYKIKGEMTNKEIQSLTKNKILGTIPHNISIHEAIISREPRDIDLRTEYGKEYDKIITHLISNHKQECKKNTIKKKSFIKKIKNKFFSFIF